MQKRGDGRAFLLLGIALVFLLSLVSADHTATLTLAPLTIYETTTATFNLSINNLFSQDTITRVETAASGLEVTGAKHVKGWTENTTLSSALWLGGTIEPNVAFALFQFTAKAGKVSANTTQTVTVTTYDDIFSRQTQALQFTVLNDETGPVFSDVKPLDGSFAAQGTRDYAVHVTATDPETGVDHIDVSYQLCNATSAANATQLVLSRMNDTYSRAIDLSSYVDHTFLCFNFNGASNGDATSSYTSRLGIDGVAPTVTLTSPANGAMINSNMLFQFNASDNLAPTLHCDLVIDGNIVAGATVANGASGSFPATNATEGIHSWNVMCTDGAGLSGVGQARTYTLDKTPPGVASTPVNGSIMAGGTMITFSVTDNFQLNQVTLSYNSTTSPQSSAFALDTTAWPDGPTTVTVTASDQAGNVGVYPLTYIVDRTPPIISLVSPLLSSDVHVNFTFNSFDTYDSTLRCELYVDSVLRKTQNTTGLTTSINDLVVPGTHTWRVECLDDANNRGVSANQPVTIVDLSGPDITIADAPYFTRGSPITINADITDVSGVQSATATLRDPMNNIVDATLTSSGSTYTLTYPTTSATPLGTYVATFNAIDTLNHSSASSKSFQLTYAYRLTLTLTPASAQPKAGVSASGSVRKDDGTTVPEAQITLLLPGRNATRVSLDNTKDYIYAFNAPATDGTYTVTALVTSAQNNVTYNISAPLIISTPGSNANDGSNAGNNNKGGNRGRGVTVSGSGESSKAPAAAAPAQSPAPKETGKESSPNRQPGKSEEKAPKNNKEKADKGGKTRGVGKATGFFSLDRLKDPKLLWTFAILIAITAVLTAISRKGKQTETESRRKDEEDRFGLEDYLNQRR